MWLVYGEMWLVYGEMWLLYGRMWLLYGEMWLICKLSGGNMIGSMERDGGVLLVPYVLAQL